VATYKFALLHAMADLCVAKGDDSGAPLELSTEDIAERYVELYWPQAVPFLHGEQEAVLRQNTGDAASTVRLVRALNGYGPSAVIGTTQTPSSR